MTPFTELLIAVLACLTGAAGLAVHGNLTVTLRRRPQPKGKS